MSQTTLRAVFRTHTLLCSGDARAALLMTFQTWRADANQNIFLTSYNYRDSYNSFMYPPPLLPQINFISSISIVCINAIYNFINNYLLLHRKYVKVYLWQFPIDAIIKKIKIEKLHNMAIIYIILNCYSLVQLDVIRWGATTP